LHQISLSLIRFRKADFIQAFLKIEYRSHYTVFPTVVKFFPHVLCRILKAKGFRQYVVTNGWSFVQWTKLEESGFNPVMDGCFISDDLGVQKPKKEFFEACFTEIFGRPEPSAEERSRVLIVGDSLTSDMLGGLNVGIDRCWYSSPGENENPEIPVTCRIKYLWELLPILGIE